MINFKLTQSGDIKYNDDALTITTYGQVRGSGESADSDLRAAHFRLAAALDTRVIAHRALAVAAGGAGAYVLPTAAEYDAWMIDLLDPTVSDAAVDLETAVAEMYAHKNLTGTGQGMAQQRAHAKRVILSNTDDTLTQALLLAAAPFPYLSHLQLLPFVRDHDARLGRMPVALLDRPLAFTFCQLWLALTQAIRTHQSTTNSASSRASLFVLPDIYKSLQAHRKALRPGLQRVLAMQLPSSAAVLDVIEAESCMAFISEAAHTKTGNSVIRRVYDDVHLLIIKDIEANPSPLTMLRLEPHIEDLRVQFNAKGLDTAAQLRPQVPDMKRQDTQELKRLRALNPAALPPPSDAPSTCPKAYPSANAHSTAVVEGRKSRDASENEFLSEDEDSALAGSNCFQPHPPSFSIPPRVLSF